MLILRLFTGHRTTNAAAEGKFGQMLFKQLHARAESPGINVTAEEKPHTHS